MSENEQNNLRETSERVLSEIKSKWKKILTIAVVAVVILLVFFKLIGAIFGGGGYSVNKKAIKALQTQEPKKVLAYIPKDLKKEVMDYYDLSKDELNKAIEEASMLTAFNEVRKAEITKMKVIDKNNITSKVMKKNKDTTSIQSLEIQLSVINNIWDTDDLKKFRMTTLDISLKEDDGEKDRIKSNAFSVKYKGKWYSIDCMEFVTRAAGQYVQKQIDKEKYSELFN
ncbi:MAG: hypothetical protein K2K02_07855 [Ruminococcus sp.]|nr:hypothetical protein [Ruminococcus sp.]